MKINFVNKFWKISITYYNFGQNKTNHTGSKCLEKLRRTSMKNSEVFGKTTKTMNLKSTANSKINILRLILKVNKFNSIFKNI